MPRKSLVTFVSALLFLVLVADAYASATCKTRSRCRWWSKQYVAKAKVRCLFNPIPLCVKRSASCGTASAFCAWKACINGGATASATNGPGGCTLSGFRTGWGRYGEPLEAAKRGSEEGQGAHDGFTRVEFLEREGAVVYLDDLAMTSTLDESFSRLDVIAYIESEEALANDDDDFPPERIVWQGHIHLQNGVLSQKGFDEETRQYAGQEGLTEVYLTDIAKLIPFDGSDDEFDRLAIDVMVDGGQPEEEEPQEEPQR